MARSINTSTEEPKLVNAPDGPWADKEITSRCYAPSKSPRYPHLQGAHLTASLLLYNAYRMLAGEVRGYLRPRNVLSNVVLAFNGPTTLF
jgi:hypothetical protein